MVNNSAIQTQPAVFRLETLTGLRERLMANPDTWVVVCLCAEWCSVCRGFYNVYNSFAVEYQATHPDVAFVYIDVDEDEHLTGALDLDNFPAFAFFREGSLRDMGVLKARGDAIARRLEALRMTHKIVSLPTTMKALHGALFDQ